MDGPHKVRLPLPIRIARGIRHSPLLRGLEPLWSRLRPLYKRALEGFGGRDGVPVILSGFGEVRLPASSLQEDIPPGEFPALVELLHTLRPDGVFYDVGASVGIYTFFALNRLGASGEAHAFEPEENSCRVLASRLASVRAPCPVRVNRCFVGDRTSTGTSADSVAWDVSATSDCGETRHLYLFQPEDAALSAQLSLDDYVAGDRRPPTLMKCDIEGAELLLLRGAEVTLRRHRPVLLVSSHPSLLPHFGHTAPEVESFLKDCGYTVRILNDDGEMHLLCTPATRT